jgi:predicted porin
MKTPIIPILTLILAAGSMALRAQDADLKSQVDDLKARLAALEAKTGTQTAPTAPAMQIDQNGNKLNASSRPVMLYDDGNTSLHLYGLIEATLSEVNHQSATGNTAFGYQVAWFSGNRYGFDVDHALGFGDAIGLPGLKAIAKLEGEFELPTGGFDTDNTIFNRDCWLGFYSEDLGKLTFGRQNTLTRDFTQTWGDAYGTADVVLKEGGYTNVNNFKQFIFYSAAPGGTRSDSSVVWKKRFGDNIVAGLEYGFNYKGAGGSADPGLGGAVPGDPGDHSSQQASIAFNHLAVGGGKLSFNLNYDRGDLNHLIHQAELVGGDYIVGMFRVNAGYVHYTAEQGANGSAQSRTDNSWTASFVVSPGKTDYALGYARMAGRNCGTNASGVVLNPFFGNTTAVTTATEVNGSKGTLFGSIMYHADATCDLYVAGDYMKVGGNWVCNDAQGNYGPFGANQQFSTETEVATGVRLKW